MLFTGIGPLLAWRRVSWASAKRVFRVPAIVAAVVAVGLLLFTDAADSLWAFALFTFAAFALTGLGQEFWNGAAARKRLSGESLPVGAGGVVSRNRRRYGGYIVHIGVVVLLDRDRRLLQLPDQPRRRPCGRGRAPSSTAARSPTSNRPSPPTRRSSASAACCGSKKTARWWRRCGPSRDYFRPTGQEGGTIASFFDGEATTEVGLEAGLTSDLWTSMAPNLTGVQGRVDKADAAFATCVRGGPGAPPECEALTALMLAARANPALRPTALEQINELQELTAGKIAASYLDDDAPATFRVIVDPLVTWMWIGGLIALSGALIALWPTRGRRRGALVRTEADARKEAKYREIRDAELDHAAGKLSDEDFAAARRRAAPGSGRDPRQRRGREAANGGSNGSMNGDGSAKKPENIEHG